MPTDFDFDDDEAVADEFRTTLGLDCDDDVDVEDHHLSAFGVATVKQVTVGAKEYVVVADEDDVDRLAVEVVAQDLRDEPQLFNRDFLVRHIDTERLARDLYADEHNNFYENLREEADNDGNGFLVSYESDIPDEDLEPLRDPETGDFKEDVQVPEAIVLALAEKQTEEALKDPVEYLTDMLGPEEGLDTAMRIGGLDINAAAQDAVEEDGWEHFLSRYDGKSDTTDKAHLVYWREG